MNLLCDIFAANPSFSKSSSSSSSHLIPFNFSSIKGIQSLSPSRFAGFLAGSCFDAGTATGAARNPGPLAGRESPSLPPRPAKPPLPRPAAGPLKSLSPLEGASLSNRDGASLSPLDVSLSYLEGASLGEGLSSLLVLGQLGVKLGQTWFLVFCVQKNQWKKYLSSRISALHGFRGG